MARLREWEGNVARRPKGMNTKERTGHSNGFQQKGEAVGGEERGMVTRPLHQYPTFEDEVEWLFQLFAIDWRFARAMGRGKADLESRRVVEPIVDMPRPARLHQARHHPKLCALQALSPGQSARARSRHSLDLVVHNSRFTHAHISRDV